MSQSDLLALLAVAHPDASPDQLRLMLDTIPEKASQKPVQTRSGSRPRTDASMERRRSWAASGRMPPRLACRFTLAEQAVLAVVADQCSKLELCSLALDHIAALAGVCRSSVKNAIRQAQRLGFVRIEVRRRSAWRNDPNVITIISPEWLTWLRLRSRSGAERLKGGGVKSVTPTNTVLEKRLGSRSLPNASKGFRQAEGLPERGRRARSRNGMAVRGEHV